MYFQVRYLLAGNPLRTIEGGGCLLRTLTQLAYRSILAVYHHCTTLLFKGKGEEDPLCRQLTWHLSKEG